MDYREARAREDEKMRNMERKHPVLADWCEEQGGTLELTEDTVNGSVVDGLTCRVQDYDDVLVSEYRTALGSKLRIFQNDNQTEVFHDELVGGSGGMLKAERDGRRIMEFERL